MKKILIIDNFDSFTYNLFQQIQKFYCGRVEVYRNNVLSLEQIDKEKYAALVISPGPGRPENAGISIAAIGFYGEKLPVLGICLGMQCINEVFGGYTRKCLFPVHGKATPILNNGTGLFENVPKKFKVARYHSLETGGIPDVLKINSQTGEGVVMSIMHHDKPVFGLQFHPESFMTEYGDQLIINFLKYVK
ncbi:MAG: aminodeoxychorismate/anthranilate synthase component II [Candidatus Marinimicrobia bacterium]|nr:aminodeoxychorismate/anthranilate synthase component II [Candidatus Neomarinimicrobiota bacterium]